LADWRRRRKAAVDGAPTRWSAIASPRQSFFLYFFLNSFTSSASSSPPLLRSNKGFLKTWAKTPRSTLLVRIFFNKRWTKRRWNHTSLDRLRSRGYVPSKNFNALVVLLPLYADLLLLRIVETEPSYGIVWIWSETKMICWWIRFGYDDEWYVGWFIVVCCCKASTIWLRICYRSVLILVCWRKDEIHDEHVWVFIWIFIFFPWFFGFDSTMDERETFFLFVIKAVKIWRVSDSLTLSDLCYSAFNAYLYLESRVSLLQRKDKNAPKGLWYKRTAHGPKKTFKKRKA